MELFATPGNDFVPSTVSCATNHRKANLEWIWPILYINKQGNGFGFQIELSFTLLYVNIYEATASVIHYYRISEIVKVCSYPDTCSHVCSNKMLILTVKTNS